jgi:hypothetical protein
MGGASAGSGGSDRSDEKKVDTYSNQLKKIQKKKSKTTTDKFGYTVPKKNSFVPPSVAVIKGVFGNTIDKVNLNKRMKFANKTGVQIQGLSTEQILSKDFKAKLDAKGYTRETPTGNNNGGNDNNNQPAPTIIKKTAGGQTVQTTAPTEAELSQSAAADAEEYDLRKTKKRGRSMNTLTSSQGVTDDKLTLGKKSLLGS